MPRIRITGEAGDHMVAGLLASHALLEIRTAARRARRDPDAPADDALDHIARLADLNHNLPLGPRFPRPLRESRRDRALRARPMSCPGTPPTTAAGSGC